VVGNGKGNRRINKETKGGGEEKGMKWIRRRKRSQRREQAEV
jgi:hypothetical protein